MLILFSLQLISVYLIQSLEQYYLRSYKDSLENQARLLAVFMEPGFGEGQDWAEDTVRLAREFRDLYDLDIVILDNYAQVVGSSGSQAMLGNRMIREEITRALAGQLSDNMRYDAQLEERRYYLAYPVQSDDAVVGVVYLSGSLRAVDDTLNEVKTIMLSGVILALAVSFLLGNVLTRTITTPIKEVTEQAMLMAGGDFSHKITIQASDEIGRLGETFNYLAAQLSSTINEMSSEKSKVEAIINNMTEGIIALDGSGKVIQVNPSARQMIKRLGLKVPSLGRSGFSLLRSLAGAEMIRQFVRKQQPLTAEISFSVPETVLQIKVASFQISKGKLGGTLVVLNDVTRERALTRRQEEFVADVSHELRTPLATVKSYVETLMDGAVEQPEVRDRFLAVLSRETERMVNLVKDLLSLSQMDVGQGFWHNSEISLSDLTLEAIDQLKHKLNVVLPAVILNIPEECSHVMADRDKVLRVFSNLLSNAIRYTDPDGQIVVSATEAENHIRVAIADSGQGIPASELSHVFERFYRVEKTRSRDYGGTGLGLSIARKIVEGHGGTISIESELGSGTTVAFTLPRAAVKEVAGS